MAKGALYQEKGNERVGIRKNAQLKVSSIMYVKCVLRFTWK